MDKIRQFGSQTALAGWSNTINPSDNAIQYNNNLPPLQRSGIKML